MYIQEAAEILNQSMGLIAMRHQCDRVYLLDVAPGNTYAYKTLQLRHSVDGRKFGDFTPHLNVLRSDDWVIHRVKKAFAAIVPFLKNGFTAKRLNSPTLCTLARSFRIEDQEADDWVVDVESLFHDRPHLVEEIAKGEKRFGLA